MRGDRSQQLSEKRQLDDKRAVGQLLSLEATKSPPKRGDMLLLTTAPVCVCWELQMGEIREGPLVSDKPFHELLEAGIEFPFR